VVIHSAAVADDSALWKSVIGGSWVNGKTKWKEGPMDLYYVENQRLDSGHPITKGASNFHLDDEIYYDMDFSPDIRVLATAYTPGEKDYSSLVSRLKEAGVTVIYVGGYHTESGLIIRQAKEQGMKATLVGGDALVTNEFWQIAGVAGAGTMMTFPPDPRLRPEAADVVKRFEAKKFNPETYTLYSYAAVQILKQAAEQAKSVETQAMIDVMHSGKPFKTVIGDISYDQKGDVSRLDYVVYVWKKNPNGKITYSEIK